MKQNTLILIAVVVLLVLAGGYFFLKGRQQELPVVLPQPPSVPTLPPETFPVATESTQTQTTPIPTPTESTSTQPTETSEEYVVIYDGNSYQPATLKIKLGETVTFVNRSNRAMWPASDVHPTHTLYDDTSLSEHCPNPDNTSFDACQGIQPGGSWSFIFKKKGSWKYHDHLNPSATGVIIVE